MASHVLMYASFRVNPDDPDSVDRAVESVRSLLSGYGCGAEEIQWIPDVDTVTDALGAEYGDVRLIDVGENP